MIKRLTTKEELSKKTDLKRKVDDLWTAHNIYLKLRDKNPMLAQNIINQNPFEVFIFRYVYQNSEKINKLLNQINDLKDRIKILESNK